MSRIEQSIEKANLLREKTGSQMRAPEQRQPESPFLKQLPVEEVEITNPLLSAANNYSVPIAEEYRKFKSIILQLTKKDGFKNSLMITSSIGSEGKSLTALNLAISLAQEYDHTVLLVDADLRNPSICQYLGLEPKAGLVNCLMDNLDFREALVNPGLGSLSILPAGKRVLNPVELFSSQRMKDVLADIKHCFADGFIVFDTPPVLPFADPRILGSMVDGVIFVVKEAGASEHNIAEALAIMSDTNVLGLVYNKATTASLDGGYHYYYYDYDSIPRTLGQPQQETSSKPGLFAKLFK
jgi:protein-tyrosine kinase